MDEYIGAKVVLRVHYPIPVLSMANKIKRDHKDDLVGMVNTNPILYPRIYNL